MAHLACKDHRRRVYVTDTRTLHRYNGSRCESPELLIARSRTTPARVRAHADRSVKQGSLTLVRATHDAKDA
jgi:hypothetical protein